MKKLFALALLIGALPLMEGCGTTPQTTVTNANKVVITTVNAGMTAWAAYVNAGKATQQQVDSIKGLYTTYYNAEMILKGALELSLTSTNSNGADLSAAQAAMSQAQTSLVTVLNQYLNQ